MAQIFTMSSAALPANAHVVGFVGREAISEPYAFQVGLETSDDGFDPEGALGAAASLEMHVGGGSEPHTIHGIVAAVELLHTYVGKALYRVTLVPRLWHLARSLHSRVFTDNTIIETIEAVLRHGGLATGDFRFQLLHDYVKLDHVCQYKESDLGFIARWMEREGLYYFFDHSGDREELVITDSLSFHAARTSGAVRYVPLSGSDHMALEALDVFMAKHSALPASVKLTDYDYLRPKLELAGAHDIDARGLAVVQIFGEHLRDTAEGARYARVRAEEQLADQKVFHGRGRVFRLRPNYRFQLDDHPIGAYNGKSYLVTALEHVGNQSATEPHIMALLGLGPEAKDEYLAHVTAISADVQYRAPRRAAWPRIDGYELAVVCGEAASEYAQLDEHGRYKCRIMFDESDLVDGSATTWVRMMQPHGGGVEGFHFPLRKGTEILLFFLAGDPDRPVIAGVAPNPLKPSPVTSGNHTQNVIQTGARNRLQLDDQAGAEQITLQTPYSNTFMRMGAPLGGYEYELHTNDNSFIDSGTTLTIHSGTHRDDWVKAGYFNTKVDGTVTDEFNGTHTTTIKDAVTENYHATQTTTVKGLVAEFYELGQQTDVSGAIRKAHYQVGQLTTVDGGCATEYYNAGHSTEAKPFQMLKVNGPLTEEITGSVTTTVSEAITVTCKSNSVTTANDWFSDTGGNKVEYVHSNKLTYGFGATADFKLAASFALTASIDVALKLALGLNFTFGASIDITGGVKVSCDSAVTIEAQCARLKAASAKLDAIAGVSLCQTALALGLSGLHCKI